MTSTDRWMAVYRRLPVAARNWAASARGYQLRRARYGRDADQLIQEELARDYWTPDQWRTWSEESLARMLRHAARDVPYYRDYWAKQGHGSRRGSVESLENWPILEKETVRSNPLAFIADGHPLRTLYLDSTSGTTGTPLRLYLTQRAVRAWYAAHDARCRHWHGLTRDDRWAILGSQLVVPFENSRPPFWVWNAGLRQLYLSIHHLASPWVSHYLDAMAKHEVRYLYGYSSAMYELARAALDEGRRLPLRVAISNAEPLHAHQRHIIAEAFQCPVQETYGTGEQVVGASECSAGRLHGWPSVGKMEIVCEDSPAPPGVEGDVICTGLLNEAMPLIRYRLGDRAAFSTDVDCPCGRTLPLLAGISGRNDDWLFLPGGRKLVRLDTVFKCDLPICQAQIVQESLHRVLVRVVPASGFGPQSVAIVRQRLRERIGDVEIEIEIVPRITRSASQKTRLVTCKLSEEERLAATASETARLPSECLSEATGTPCVP